MKTNSDNRINEAKNVSLEDLKQKLQSSDPSRYDQMLVEGEDRKTYYSTIFKVTSVNRTFNTLKFPVFSNLKNDFEANYLHAGSGDKPHKLDNDKTIQSIIEKGISPEVNTKYSGKKLPFNEIPLQMNGNDVALEQDTYIIPSETEMCECHGCSGEKYVTCPESECRGQHIYDCDTCSAKGEYTCPSCKGAGTLTCPKCSGSNKVKCNSCTGNGYKSDGNRCDKRCNNGWKQCDGFGCKNGKVKCSFTKSGNSLLGATVRKSFGKGHEFCGGKGIIQCKKCEAKGKIECKTCYGDQIEGRYGKVDCETCEAAGQLGTISYIETSVSNINEEDIVCDGNIINADDFSKSTINSNAESGSPIETYFNLNGETRENYDNHSELISKSLLNKHGLKKDDYPQVVSEEIYYNAVPCSTIEYQHILSGSNHDVSIIGVDQKKEILWHSDPTQVKVKKVEKNAFKDLIGKAFSSGFYKAKIDKRNEIIFMVHMAKADGLIEDSEKKVLAKYISDLNNFTSKEKKELFDLMSAQTLPPIENHQAVFSSPEREIEVQRKLKEIIGKADGEFEDAEKKKLNELIAKIEEARGNKKGFFGNFFGTWQVSVPLILLLAVIGYVVFWSMFILPVSNAESLHGDLLKKELAISNFIKGVEPDMNDMMFDDFILEAYQAKDEINNLVHESELTFDNNGKETSYHAFWDEKRAYYLDQIKDMDDSDELLLDDEAIKEENLEKEEFENEEEIDEEIHVNYSAVIGSFSGDFGDDQIIITISDVDEDGNAKGYNQVGNNSRDLTGDIEYSEDGYFRCTMNEPGDDKWDGVFDFTIDIDGNLNGTWTANNDQLTREFSITKD